MLLLALDLDLPAEAVAGLGAGRVVRLGFAELDARRLAETMPGMVAMPLWSPTADAVQMLQMLDELGYAGPVHVFAPHLPDRRMVFAELKAVSPLLRISLIESNTG